MSGRWWFGSGTAERRPVRAVALLALSGMLVLAGLPGLAVRTMAKEPGDWPAAELYVVEQGGVDRLVPLDGGTLEFQTGRPEASVEAIADGWMPVLSADGSTLALPIELGRVVSIREGLFGPEKVRIEVEAEIGELFLSDDGSRLIASVWGYDAPAWKTFDARDGRLLATVRGEQPAPWQLFAVDAEAGRLYRLTLADGSGVVAEPRPTRLIVYDLTTGAESGRLELPEIWAGFWQDEEIITFAEGGQERLSRVLEPGMALSPDGGRLAIAHAHNAGLTVIDTAKLAVEGSREIARATGWLGRAVGWLGLAPQSASAKALEGIMLRAVIAPDGQHLYVFGAEASIEDGVPTYRGRGLQAVDVESGRLVGEGLGEMPIDRVVASPDGNSLYVAGYAGEATNANPMPSFVIRRVDAVTLEVLAERSFPDWRVFLMRSGLADPELPLTVELAEMAFVPGIVVVPAATEVELVLTNHDEIAHNFTVTGETDQLDLRLDLAPGETKRLTVTAPAGEYKLFCAMEGHPEAGMGGVLVAR